MLIPAELTKPYTFLFIFHQLAQGSSCQGWRFVISIFLLFLLHIRCIAFIIYFISFFPYFSASKGRHWAYTKHHFHSIFFCSWKMSIQTNPIEAISMLLKDVRSARRIFLLMERDEPFDAKLEKMMRELNSINELFMRVKKNCLTY